MATNTAGAEGNVIGGDSVTDRADEVSGIQRGMQWLIVLGLVYLLMIAVGVLSQGFRAVSGGAGRGLRAGQDVEGGDDRQGAAHLQYQTPDVAGGGDLLPWVPDHPDR